MSENLEENDSIVLCPPVSPSPHLFDALAIAHVPDTSFAVLSSRCNEVRYVGIIALSCNVGMRRNRKGRLKGVTSAPYP